MIHDEGLACAKLSNFVQFWANKFILLPQVNEVHCGMTTGSRFFIINNKCDQLTSL